MITTHDGTLVVAADPDRDQLYFIEIKTQKLLHTRALQVGDEPGRLVEDAAGRIHVVLRSGHAIASMERDAASPITRREVCDVPRGVAYEAGRDLLHVACAEGKLVSLNAAPEGTVQRVVEVGGDARDVLVRGDKLFVSRFRNAELLVLDADGAVVDRKVPPSFWHMELQSILADSAGQLGCPTAVGSQEAKVDNVPTLSWRMVDVPNLGVTMLHQRAKTGQVQISRGGYGAGASCASSIVQTSITTAMDTEQMGSTDLSSLAVAVDLATDPDGALLAVVAPGNAGLRAQVQVFRLDPESSFVVASQPDIGTNSFQGSGGLPVRTDPPQPGGEPDAGTGNIFFHCLSGDDILRDLPGQATAVTFASPYILAVQEREPAAISFVDMRTNRLRSRIVLSQSSRFDTGHALFHQRASSGLACASCHAEGGDDGRVWEFLGTGQRRTQTLRGGLLGTEPFHWSGDMHDLPMLVHEVFVGRMSGFSPTPEQTDALAHWLDKQPALHAKAKDEAAAARGKLLFESPAVDCGSCHSGSHLTNNRSEDVGTGALFQVPSLHGVAFRTPLMHDGCAATLADRFNTDCGGDKHGHTSQLSQPELADLVSYLETL